MNRFSIAWTRIIPGGTGEENPEGIEYYKNLISALKAEGIEPTVTLYHWDLPQVLSDQVGSYFDGYHCRKSYLWVDISKSLINMQK